MEAATGSACIAPGDDRIVMPLADEPEIRCGQRRSGDGESVASWFSTQVVGEAGAGMGRWARWMVAGAVTVGSLAAVTALCGAVVLPPMMEDDAIRWGLASSVGAALAALAAAWGYGFATRAPQNPGATPPDRSAHASGSRSVAVAGDSTGSISTGDSTPRALPPQPPAQPPATPVPSSPPSTNSTASASGERSVAIGGNSSGNLSTGDQTEATGP